LSNVARHAQAKQADVSSASTVARSSSASSTTASGSSPPPRVLGGEGSRTSPRERRAVAARSNSRRLRTGYTGRVAGASAALTSGERAPASRQFGRQGDELLRIGGRPSR
jgi:hypothetical protein